MLFLAAVNPGKEKESASGNYQLQGTPNTRNGEKTGQQTNKNKTDR